MSIITHRFKGDSLSYDEMDDNLDLLNDGGRLNDVLYYSAGTYVYTKPEELKFIIVRMVGGGGGGAGCPATGTSQQAVGGPGGGAGYTEKKILAADLAASETVTVGAGGAGGVGAEIGDTGGTSSFGTHCSATGGTGGGTQTAQSSTLNIQANSGAAGYGTGGNLNMYGEKGPRATLISTLGLFLPTGAAPVFGATTIASSVNGNGSGGAGRGSGGTGGQNSGPSQPARTGGNGSGGIMIIEEYF